MCWALFSLVSKYNDCKKLCVEYHPKDLDENNILLAFSLYGECTVNIETELKGKPMIITWCEKQCPSSNAKLWVSITGPPINNDDFEALLSRFGAVDSFEVVLQHLDSSYWIVQFDSETSTTKAIKFFNGAEKYGMKL